MTAGIGDRAMHAIEPRLHGRHATPDFVPPNTRKTARELDSVPGTKRAFRHSPLTRFELEEDNMRKYLLAAAMVGAIAAPALADEVGVHVGPVGAGVTVGEGHDHYRDRDY